MAQRQGESPSVDLLQMLANSDLYLEYIFQKIINDKTISLDVKYYVTKTVIKHIPVDRLLTLSFISSYLN